jgi:hypothetical protein
MTKLELVDTEALLQEVRTRFTGLVVLGVPLDQIDAVVTVMDGPAYMVAGLLHQALCGVTATLEKPIDE